MFAAANPEHTVEETNNTYVVPYTDEVYTPNGWVKVKNLMIGDIICGEDSQDIIREIRVDNNKNYLLVV